MTISNISAPGTYIRFACALIVQLNHAGFVIGIGLVVINISAAKCYILAETIVTSYFPCSKRIFRAFLLESAVVLKLAAVHMIISCRSGSLCQDYRSKQ
jgi:hypothetical protein